jgi:hypothetical protein
MKKRAALSSGKVKLVEPPTALRTLVMSRHRLQEDSGGGGTTSEDVVVFVVVGLH